MDTVVGVEERDETKFEDSTIAETSSAPSLSKQIADPVVYKLVRVEGDGRLVPATDDEVMEVEDMFECDKIEMHFVVDPGQAVGCTSNNGFSSGKIQLKASEGLLQSETLEVDAEKSNAPHETAVDLGKLNARVEEIVPSLTQNSNDSHIDQSGGEECSNPLGESIESVTSTSSWKPDFSKLKGKICLDNLSVRELHETFKATFGRETSVKDKQWLKRRIAMALTNSCDISTDDNRGVKKGKEEGCKSMDGTLAEVPVFGVTNDNCGGSSVDHNNQTENNVTISVKRLRNPSLEYNCVGEDLHIEQRAAKRVRKPTRRYIEEASEVEPREYSGKLIHSVKSSGHGHPSPQAHARPGQNVQSNVRPLVTRQDSLGGSGVQVPYVSRVRRGRPRENFMALMEKIQINEMLFRHSGLCHCDVNFQKLHPSGMGIATRLVKKALGVRSPRLDNERGNKVFKARLAPGWVQQPLITEPEKDEQYLERKTTEFEKDEELKQMDSSGENSDDNVVTGSTVKCGLRRKHHRPWTLGEVVKLVEGVARYGAGRWSEIKRIAFASYSYRTSVDLKDKWRNLLRASFAQLPAEKEMQNSRKHASTPIPAPILLRVRELAELQAQVSPDLSLSRLAGRSGRSVQETRSGYL